MSIRVVLFCVGLLKLEQSWNPEHYLSLCGHTSTCSSWSGHAVRWGIGTCASHPVPLCCCWTAVAFSLSVELVFLRFYCHGSFLSDVGFTTWNCVAEPPGDCIMPYTGTQKNMDRDIIRGILQQFHSVLPAAHCLLLRVPDCYKIHQLCMWSK